MISGINLYFENTCFLFKIKLGAFELISYSFPISLLSQQAVMETISVSTALFTVDAKSPCIVKFGTRDVNINAVTLIYSDLDFAFQGIILLCFGSSNRWVTTANGRNRL
jgi:hypothetical protein